MISFKTQSMMFLGVVLAIILAHEASSLRLRCPCSNQDLCKPLEKVFSTKPEVYAFSRNTSNIFLWRWSTIDAIIAPPSFDKKRFLEAETMCMTHAKKKKYGISVEFNVTDVVTPGTFTSNTSQFEAKAWVASVVLKEGEWDADIVTIDLLSYFNSDKASQRTDHLFLAMVLHQLHTNLKNGTETLCIVPWKPPCTKTDESSCDFAFLVRDACSYFVLHPDSFLDARGSKCTARANVPLSKLLYGISEYNVHHIPSNRIILGVSWHGYDYTCSLLENDVCDMMSSPINGSLAGGQTCNLDQRERVSYGDIVKNHREDYDKHDTDELQNAPFFNYKVGSERHQVWFEDRESLTHKYRLMHELELKGIAILYGDDLNPSIAPNLLADEDIMWSWLSHETLLKTTAKHKHSDLHWADTMAGVAVGCFLLGALLGIVFTCISMQKRIRRPQQPFHRDTDPMADDFMDDPDL